MVLHLGLNHKLESENDPQFTSKSYKKYLWILLKPFSEFTVKFPGLQGVFIVLGHTTR